MSIFENLKTLAEKSAFIKTAKANKSTAVEEVNAATDAAIRAAINVGIACNGALPDKRVLKKQFPDGIRWDDVQANLLTYARLIMQGEGETVTMGKGDNAADYTITAEIMEKAPYRLSTIATTLRSHFEAKAQAEAYAAKLSEITAITMRNNDESLYNRYASAEALETAIDVATEAETHNEPHNEELLKAWRAEYKNSESNLTANKESEAREQRAAQILALLEGFEIDASDGANSKALAAVFGIGADETGTIRIAA